MAAPLVFGALLGKEIIGETIEGGFRLAAASISAAGSVAGGALNAAGSIIGGAAAGATFASRAALLHGAFCIVVEVVSRFAIARPYGRAQLFCGARSDAASCRIFVILL